MSQTQIDRTKIGQIKYTQEVIRERKEKALALCLELNSINDDIAYFQKRLRSLTHDN